MIDEVFKPVRGRSCGNCKLCCTLLPVQFDDGSWKRSLDRCRFVCGRGCAIYADRPEVCRVWSCRWLMDEDTGALRRPDHTHYVIDVMPDEIRMSNGTEDRILNVVQVWVDPAFRQAWRDPALLGYLEKLGGRPHYMPAIIRFGSNEAFVLFPPSLSADGRWHESDATLGDDIGLYARHEEGRRPPR